MKALVTGVGLVAFVVIIGLIYVFAIKDTANEDIPLGATSTTESARTVLIDRPHVEVPVLDNGLDGFGKTRPKPYEVIGHSVEGREIRAYRFGTGASTLVFVGALHGGYEWNTALLAYEVIDQLTNDPSLVPSQLSVYVIPVANPDGLYRVVNTTERFGASEAPQFDYASEVTPLDLAVSGRFNAHTVDLNRNFDCEWQPDAVWRTQPVSAGTGPFSEPEAVALRDFFLRNLPQAVVFYHSASDGVYGSSCGGARPAETKVLLSLYGNASGYPQHDDYLYYAVTGDATDWLATRGVPAVTVELRTHNVIEWSRNWPAILAMFRHYSGTR